MENWSFAQTDFINDETNGDLELTLKILSSNKTTPMLVINEDGSLVVIIILTKQRLPTPFMYKN
ncbi:hypothetical protein JCM19274_3105 [Algibacter lectus]|uniref:Uncharacterized protein n=1 Tax=Algibacter lectus TaxID=221126 RepID=A0A090WTY5_9FLAO|nr:hypothetical protein JCM19274_3105 [Algibacter lectus]